MDEQELLSRLANLEDNFTERKSAGVSPQELRQTLCAFANSLDDEQVAILFIGVDDKTGKVTGVKAEGTDALQKRVREAAEQACYPPITTISSQVIDVYGLLVVAVLIKASTERPHFTGPAYVRQLSESVKASSRMFEELILQRSDKVRAILKMRGKTISFQCLQHKIGDTKIIPDQGYREGGECVVDDCSAHVVHLTILAGGLPIKRVAEPLPHVQIYFDVPNGRDMLLIRAA